MFHVNVNVNLFTIQTMVFPCARHEGIWRNGAVAPLNLKLGTT
jgi:hypothetical protein